MNGDENKQLADLLSIVHTVLGDDLVGLYLFGSAVQGGLKPRSDMDVMAVTDRSPSAAQKQGLISRLLELSGNPRHLELTLVVQDQVRPWRYPPQMEFQYGDWWRDEFERGELEPWERLNPDLASLIRMVLIADTALYGPPPGEIFDPVPRKDYVSVLLHGVDELLQDVDTDTCNVILTLARIWNGLATDEILTKNAAADWATPRLPDQHQSALAEARAIYLGVQTHESNDFRRRARSCAAQIIEKIHEEADLETGDPAH